MNLLSPEPIYTADDLLRNPLRKGYELVDGKLVELKTGAEASYIGGQLFCHLLTYSLTQRLGWVFPPGINYQLFFPDHPNLVRKPDGSFVRLDRGEDVVPGFTCRVADFFDVPGATAT
jgi:hypothetical protein